MQINNIYCMDCVDGMSLLDKAFVDLVFTSPPYYNAKEYACYDSYDKYLDFLRIVIEKIYYVLNDDGVFVLNTSPVIVPRKGRNFESVRLPIPFDSFCIAQSCGFKYIDDIVWEKPDGASNRAVKFSAHRRPLSYKPFTVTEYLFVFRKSNAPLIDKGIRKHSQEIINKSLVGDGYERTNIWKISPTRSKLHPAPFPSKLSDSVVTYYSYIGDLVFDPFAGIGTTLMSAKKLGRNFLGFDTNKDYVDVANKGLMNLDKCH